MGRRWERGQRGIAWYDIPVTSGGKGALECWDRRTAGWARLGVSVTEGLVSPLGQEAATRDNCIVSYGRVGVGLPWLDRPGTADETIPIQYHRPTTTIPRPTPHRTDRPIDGLTMRTAQAGRPSVSGTALPPLPAQRPQPTNQTTHRPNQRADHRPSLPSAHTHTPNQHPRRVEGTAAPRGSWADWPWARCAGYGMYVAVAEPAGSANADRDPLRYRMMGKALERLAFVRYVEEWRGGQAGCGRQAR